MGIRTEMLPLYRAFLNLLPALDDGKHHVAGVHRPAITLVQCLWFYIKLCVSGTTDSAGKTIPLIPTSGSSYRLNKLKVAHFKPEYGIRHY